MPAPTRDVPGKKIAPGRAPPCLVLLTSLTGLAAGPRHELLQAIPPDVPEQLAPRIRRVVSQNSRQELGVMGHGPRPTRLERLQSRQATHLQGHVGRMAAETRPVDPRPTPGQKGCPDLGLRQLVP